ncbi:hypothetical protein MMC31_001510 [Peltigera leucophlebia]|nr:hypothetical protein [Peltigera leucophlebia]
MSQAILSNEAIHLITTRWSATICPSSKPGFQKIVSPAELEIWEIPQILESEATLEFMGFRSDQAREIYKTFQQEKQPEQEDPLLATTKNYLTTRFTQFNHHPLRLIPALTGVNLEIGDGLCSLMDNILNDIPYQLNDVSKQDLFIWTTITVQRGFLSLKSLNAKILNPYTPPTIPPLSFPLSLKPGVSPGQTIGNIPVPNGFLFSENESMPCWNDPPPKYPHLQLEPGEHLVELIDPGVPSGYREENGRRIPYWTNPAAPRLYIVDEEHQIIDEIHHLESSQSTPGPRKGFADLL